MIYRYKPTRVIIITLIFAIIALFISFWIRNEVFPFRIAMGIVFIIVIFNLIIKIVYIKVEIKDFVIYYNYRSLFRHIRKTVAADEVKSLYLSDKLILETKSGEKLVVNPIYYPTPEVLVLEHNIRQLPDAYKDENEKSDQQDEDETNRIIPHQKIWMFVEMSVKCPYCDVSVNINGPYTEFICPHCQSKIDFNPQKWADMFEDIQEEVVEEIEPGHGTKSTVMGVFDAQMFYGRMVPYCKQCKQDFDLNQDFISREFINCQKCGLETSVILPPAWFNSVIAGSFIIIDAFAGQENMLQKKYEPFVIKCPKCAGDLNINGQQRIKKCPHCGISYYIPDNLWKKFHPSPVKNRWFIGFET